MRTAPYHSAYPDGRIAGGVARPIGEIAAALVRRIAVIVQDGERPQPH